MAETQEVKNSKAAAHATAPTKNVEPEFASDTAPETGVAIGVDKFSYKIDKLKEVNKLNPIQGLLLGQLELPNPKALENQPKVWYPFVVRLTKACHVVNADNQIVVGKPGDDILIASGKLNSELAGIASDLENVGEVWIKPLNQRAISGGRKMWVFDMKVLRSEKRTFATKLMSGNVITPESRRLAAAASFGEGADSGDMPF